jgi:hypothetical protein
MIRIIKTYPSAQTLGFFDVELRYIGQVCGPVQRDGGHRVDQPYLQPRPLRIPIPNRDCHGPPLNSED